MNLWLNLRKLKVLETERQILPDIKAVTLFGAAHPLCLIGGVYIFFLAQPKGITTAATSPAKRNGAQTPLLGGFVICFFRCNAME